MKEILPGTLQRKSSLFFSEGSVWFHENTHAHAIIRLKRKFIEEFPSLKERKPIFYRLESLQTFEEIQSRIAELKKSKQGIPILLFLYEDESN